MATTQTVNTILWIFGLALQTLLVAAVFGRHIANRVPWFTTLILFYPLRSAALFLLAEHVAPATYASISSDLISVDLLLQFAVAFEIAVRALRYPVTANRRTPVTVRRGLTLLLPILAATLSILLLLAVLPAHAPIPVDRVQLFLSLLLLALLPWTLATSRSPLLRRISLGLALYSSVSVLSLTAHLRAAIQQNAAAYAFWSYAATTAYLLVVLLWILTLRPDPEPST